LFEALTHWKHANFDARRYILTFGPIERLSAIVTISAIMFEEGGKKWSVTEVRPWCEAVGMLEQAKDGLKDTHPWASTEAHNQWIMIQQIMAATVWRMTNEGDNGP